MNRLLIAIGIVIAIFLAGCHTPPEEEDFPYTLHIRTRFVANESDEGAMVPDGSPASGAPLSLSRRTLFEEMDQDRVPTQWDHDPPCPFQKVGMDNTIGRYRCEDHPVRNEVRLPPVDTDVSGRGIVLVYPLPENGEITFRSHELFSTGFSVGGPFSEQLMALRTSPDENCDPLLRTHGYDELQGITVKSVGSSVAIEFKESGSMTFLWKGFCDPHDPGTQS